MECNISLVHVVFVFFGLISLATEDDFTFGGCEPGRESCQDCYLTLAKSLLDNNANVLNLTNAFFPPNKNPPDSVIVIYHFHNESMDRVSLWFWADSSGYFLYPVVVFQFLSLFFGKPKPLYEQKVEVTLNATECLDISDEHMTLLTNRVSTNYCSFYDSLCPFNRQAMR